MQWSSRPFSILTASGGHPSLKTIEQLQGGDQRAMYTRPEVRELGSVSAFTLGSNHSGSIPYVKANNSTSDNFTGYTGDYGSPCTVGTNGCG